MKQILCSLVLCCTFTLTEAHEPVIRVLSSSDASATAKFLQGLTVFTSVGDYNAAAGAPEWCVDFESETQDSQFRTQAFSAQDTAMTFTPFSMQQDSTTSDVSPFVNLISGAAAPRQAIVFVNNDGGASTDVTVSMNINIPVVSWRATVSGIQSNPAIPSDGVRLTLVLQTSSTSVSINTINDGFLGFTVAENDKVMIVRFQGDQNVNGGETFNVDNVCGSATPFVPSESPSGMPSLTPTQSPTRSPVPDPEPECFAQGIFLLGPIICFVLDILGFIF